VTPSNFRKQKDPELTKFFYRAENRGPIRWDLLKLVNYRQLFTALRTAHCSLLNYFRISLYHSSSNYMYNFFNWYVRHHDNGCNRTVASTKTVLATIVIPKKLERFADKQFCVWWWNVLAYLDYDRSYDRNTVKVVATERSISKVVTLWVNHNSYIHPTFKVP